MAHLANEAADMALTGQRMALSVLLAEMRALSAMMPGQAPAAQATGPDAAARTEARHRAEEAEVEAGFDNMPV